MSFFKRSFTRSSGSTFHGSTFTGRAFSNINFAHFTRCLVGGTLCVSSLYVYLKDVHAEAQQTESEQTKTKKITTGLVNRDFIADAAEKAMPTVVNITLVASNNSAMGQVTAISNGSGFIVTPDGTVLTCAHVVNPSMGLYNPEVLDIVVRLNDGRRYNAKIQAMDTESDLALLKLTNTKDHSSFPTLEFGSSDKLRTGEWVIALGSPLALENTVTAGIVSAVSRYLPGLGEYIQFDTPIYRGSSGGPLVNADGKVVGINVMKVLAKCDGSFGLAVPVDTAKEVVSQLLKKGRVDRPYIGIFGTVLTDEIIENEKRIDPGFSASFGVLIADVEPHSPAAKSGLNPGDVVLECDGEKLVSDRQLQKKIGWEVGKIHKLKVLDQNTKEEKEVQIKTVLKKGEPSKKFRRLQPQPQYPPSFPFPFPFPETAPFPRNQFP